MRRAAAFALIGAVCLAAGCGSGGLPVTHYYTLSPPGEVAPSAPPQANGWALAVESLDVATPYDQDRLVYRESFDSTEVGFYAYHRWAAPLGRLAQAALIEELPRVPGVRSVEAMGSNGAFDARLTGRFAYIEEIESASSEEARISIQLALRDRSGEDLWSATLTGSEVGPFTDGGDLAVTLHRVFRGLIDRASSEIATALATIGSP